jgi:hypothetical protein
MAAERGAHRLPCISPTNLLETPGVPASTSLRHVFPRLILLLGSSFWDCDIARMPEPHGADLRRSKSRAVRNGFASLLGRRPVNGVPRKVGVDGVLLDDLLVDVA